MEAKKKRIHVNLNSKRLHDIRMKRRAELQQKALDMGADRFHNPPLYDEDLDPLDDDQLFPDKD